MYSLIQLVDKIRQFCPEYSDTYNENFACELIMCTKKHEVNSVFSDIERSDAKLFLDFDLSILAVDNKQDLLDFENNIRKEFCQFSDADYKEGRIKSLSSFATRENLFQSVQFAKLNWRAHQNLSFLINHLGK
jgi:predicted metal-dependent HD superfamily phosphohydrolase